jgi:hypothetical protein
MNNTAKIELTIDEVLALIEYHEKMWEHLPREHYNKKNSQGVSFGDREKRHEKRLVELKTLLDNTWAK